MGLGEELSNLRMQYRKIFLDCAQQIQAALDEGQSIEQLENQYKEMWSIAFSEIEKNRALCECSGCGVCCKFAVSEFSPEELALKAQNGDNFAEQFISTFVPYESLETVKKIYPEYVEFLQTSADGKFYFYHCPKVTKDNKCPDYENRPQICKDFPDNPIAFLPVTCTFTPWKLKSESVCLKLNAEKEIINFYLKGNVKK